MFFVERFNGRGWVLEASGLPTRSEALHVVESLRRIYPPRTLFRLIVR